MRIIETVQALVKAQEALDNLNIGEAKSRLDDAIKDLSHPVLQFLIVDEAAWFAAVREDSERTRREIQKEYGINFNGQIEQLETKVRTLEAELQAMLKRHNMEV